MVDICFTQADFFQRADTLWQQLERGLTVEAAGSPSPLREICAAGQYTYLMATADQVFTHDVMLAFLSRLRRWAKERLDARHASTPQIHIYRDGCARALSPDAVPTRWHYLYSLTRGEPASIRLLEPNGQRRWFGIVLSRIANLPLGFNQLLVHETCQAYELNAPTRARKPLEGAILLHGYLW
ncbi:MAG: hypothetical protein ABSF45_04140 [Terriglobia bacterium]